MGAPLTNEESSDYGNASRALPVFKKKGLGERAKSDERDFQKSST